MTQAREPDDRGLDRTLRSFDRVYEEIDELKAEMNQRFDRVESEVKQVNGKIDTLLRHVTGQGNS
jgi:SMC interacting uncharacterized protein involved in chromosome segregation